MKRNKIVLYALLGFVVAVSSCSKFLERPPVGQLTESEAIYNDSSLMAFANAMYTYAGDAEFLGGRVQNLSEMLADQLDGSKLTGDFSEIYKRQNSIFGGTRDKMYIKGYKLVNAANIVLENLNLATTNKNYLAGEAYFFRGMAHFEFVRLFAQPYGYSADNSHLGIPLRLNTLPNSINRSSVAEVYAQVIADLKLADSLLPASANDGGKFYTATKWIAKAYLAKVYFQMNDFKNAFTYADAVIKSGNFQPDNNYNARFSLGQTKEAILRIANQINHFQPGTELNGNWRSDTKPPTLFFTNRFFSYATSNPTDARNVWYSSSLQAGYNGLTKYNIDYMELPIVHLTEIKLIRAEAGAETATQTPANLVTAIGDMNDILTRVYGNTTQNLTPGTSALGVIVSARTQRELEMVGEGNRLQEIKRIGVRTGLSIDRRGSPWNCNGLILQFPKAEQDANAAFQLNPEGGCF